MLTLGIDEVGRGSLAGPLVIGAVILKVPIDGLKDSKQLTKNQRLRLSSIIYKQASYCGLGWVMPDELDKLGLSKALVLATNRSLEKLKIRPDLIIIDGTVNYLDASNYKASTLIKADQSVPAVMAASIIAKVARDNYMIDLARYYQDYDLVNNVGYGTAKHLKALAMYGPTDIHRYSFKPIKDKSF